MASPATTSLAVCVMSYLVLCFHFIQAVLAQAEGLDGEASETHYYYPATIANTPTATMVTNVQAPDSLLAQNTPTGELQVFSVASVEGGCLLVVLL